MKRIKRREIIREIIGDPFLNDREMAWRIGKFIENNYRRRRYGRETKQFYSMEINGKGIDWAK